VAALQLDSCLSPGQIEALVDLAVQEYRVAIQTNKVKEISKYS
jgi:hypothetical protein